MDEVGPRNMFPPRSSVEIIGEPEPVLNFGVDLGQA